MNIFKSKNWDKKWFKEKIVEASKTTAVSNEELSCTLLNLYKDAANIQSASRYKMVIVGSLTRIKLCEEELRKQFVVAR